MIDRLIWYVSYGSNMHGQRLACYLGGGTPFDGHRSYPGARDPRPPRRDSAVSLPGRIYFATHSPVWGGGRVFYDPGLPGPAAARAWLITESQFADIIAQEMYREPGTDLDLTEVFATGHSRLGPGRYETLLRVGDFDGYPLLVFTAPWHAADVPAVAPSLAYLRMLAAGLIAAHKWDTHRTATYLTNVIAAATTWTPETLAQWLEAEPLNLSVPGPMSRSRFGGYPTDE